MTLDSINQDIGEENQILMDNAPGQTGYNKKIHRVSRLAIIDVKITKPHYPWKNNPESVIHIVKGKYNRRRVHKNITKRVQDFGIVWEYEIYPRTVGKDGRPPLEHLAGDTIEISEWMEFDFYEIVWFWNNQSDDTKQMVGLCLRVSNRFGIELC